MKKRDVLDLIKYHSEGNDVAFREAAGRIAREFDNAGDHQLADFVMAQISDANAFMPQSDDGALAYFTKLRTDRSPLALPEVISDDMLGVKNAIQRNAGMSKFLLQGPPGTGKTESVKYLAHMLGRDLLMVDFDSVIDSRLGRTGKNIAALFDEMRAFPSPDKLVFLFDEIDALALDRINANDVREMGRATSSFLKEMDRTGEEFVVFATTNLYGSLDKALVRRFDVAIDFGRYTREDLVELSEFILEDLLRRYSFVGRDMRLFRKIMDEATSLPFPGELKNALKTCIAFSDPEDEYDYLKRIYRTFGSDDPADVKGLHSKGFTLREIERLSGVSKSTVARMLKG